MPNKRILKQTKKLMEIYKLKHKDRYNYSKFKYIDSDTKVEIICPEHGSWFTKPLSHRECGCPKCAGFGLTNDERNNLLYNVHDGKYDYSQSISNKNSDKITIICKDHGTFIQRYSDHKNGNGCPKCGGVHRYNTEEIIEQFINIHGNKYNYSSVDYVGWDNKVEIICPKHGVFKQTPHNHKSGDGCPICAGRYLNNQLIIEQFIDTHGDKYDYSIVDYQGATTKVEIICPKHGVFKQAPIQHKKGNGCPICKESKGEEIIRLFLINNNINFIQEYFVSDGINNKEGNRYDFYLPEIDTYLEYQGIQHYKPVEFFGGEEQFLKRQYKDFDKFLMCTFSGADLLTIPFYYINRIDEYLSYYLMRGNINE